MQRALFVKLLTEIKHRKHTVAVTGETEDDLRALRKGQIGISDSDSVDIVRAFCSVQLEKTDGNKLTLPFDMGWNIWRSVQTSVATLIMFQVCVLGLSLVSALAGRESPLNSLQLLWLKIMIDVFTARALVNE